MGTTAPGPVYLLDLCDQKLLDFVYNVDNKDFMWLKEIEEEAERMFVREFNNEPELMPKTPSQKNRRKKRRVSNIQDENRDPVRKRLSRRKSRSSQVGARHLRSKPGTVVEENGSPVLRRITRAAAAAAAAATAAAAAAAATSASVAAASSPTTVSPIVLIKKAVVEVSTSERLSAELQLIKLKGSLPPSSVPAPATSSVSQGTLTSEEEATPKKSEAGRLDSITDSVTVNSLKATPQSPKNRGVGEARSVSKLKIAQASRGLQDSLGSTDSPWQERVLSPILPNNILPTTAKNPLGNIQSVRQSLIFQDSQVPLAKKYCLVAEQENASRRSSRIAKKAGKEPEASARIICHSYLERLLNVEVPQNVGLEKEPVEVAEPEEAVEEQEVSKNSGPSSKPRSATKISISTPTSKPVTTGQATAVEVQDAELDKTDGHREPPQSVRRKRSYKQAMSEPDEEQLEDEELQPPQNKTPSPPCPANKVVRPLRTFLHTVQKNQMLMTPTLASRSSVMKSFIKRNTPLRVDPKEKERQRLESLRRKEEAEQLRRQKVEEDKRRRLEEVKLKREERLRKVLQARERVEQMKEEKKKQIEQKFAQIDEKTEKAKEERLAEKAKKKATAKKMEEAEARRKQEEEARRLRWLQQEEEERRHQEMLQRKKEEEQERRKAAEARRLAEQRDQERRREQERREQERREQERREQERREQERREQERREQERLRAKREMQEREKALRLQKERLQRELEEKKKKEEQQRLAEQQLQEEQAKKAKEVAAGSKVLNMTVDVQMTPQGPKSFPKISMDDYGMDLNSDDSTDDEAHPRKPIPSWAKGTQLSQAIVHQYYHPPNILELFGSILPLDLEDIFKKRKTRYHKRTSSAVWNSPPLKATIPSSGD